MRLLLIALVVLVPAAGALAQTTTPLPLPAPVDSSQVQPDSTAVPQRDAFDVIHKLLGKNVQPQYNLKPEIGLQWALLPTFSVNPVYGTAIGVMVNAAGVRGSADARYSQFSISANVATSGQIQAQVRGDVFSKNGDYLLKLDWRYLDTQRSTWGLGPVREQQNEFPMEFVLYRTYATLMRVVSGPVFTGIGVHYDVFDNIVDLRAEEGDLTPYRVYSRGLPTKTTAVGLSFNVLGDTRDNVINASSGYLINWSFRGYLESLGSDEDWQEFWVEARVYPHLPKKSRNVLAFWLYAWMTFGTPPYLNLPSNGWDTYGRGARGYLAGRIRGNDQIYLEAEYRWNLTKDGLWGMVVFLNGTSTTTVNGTFSRLDPGVGTGLRIKFNKNTASNLTLDYGWGRDDSSGFFLGMSEAF
jgi:hypothetical protein